MNMSSVDGCATCYHLFGLLACVGGRECASACALWMWVLCGGPSERRMCEWQSTAEVVTNKPNCHKSQFRDSCGDSLMSLQYPLAHFVFLLIAGSFVVCRFGLYGFGFRTSVVRFPRAEASLYARTSLAEQVANVYTVARRWWWCYCCCESWYCHECCREERAVANSVEHGNGGDD